MFRGLPLFCFSSVSIYCLECGITASSRAHFDGQQARGRINQTAPCSSHGGSSVLVPSEIWRSPPKGWEEQKTSIKSDVSSEVRFIGAVFLWIFSPSESFASIKL